MTLELIAKKYRVLKSLGQGSMGEVYLVLPPRGDPVALKLLKTGDGGNPKGAIDQFENEFKVLKKLSHPNIGSLYDYGLDEELKKVYFTSPWLKGCDLYEATLDLPIEKCEDYFVQVLRALNYLHQKGIIHCDLKPGNIFVENGRVQLIDFGLAGYWGESIVGTPTYLAPEIYRGERHSIASDLYAVGVIFYNCLTRTQPFSGKDLQEIYDRHRTFTPPPVWKINPKIPRYLSDITQSLMAKKPEERYLSAAAVIEDISAFSKTNYSVETRETLLSYLPTTADFIGRDEVQWQIENQLEHFLDPSSKKPFVGLFIYGESGMGKSKLLNLLKNRVQLAKISVEEALLPLTESDQKILYEAPVILLDNAEQYAQDPSLNQFLSILEQKILNPETKRFLFVVTGNKKEDWKPFENLFPPEDFLFESLLIPPFSHQETQHFLETVIGQKKIPETFVSEIYRNTGGNPGICQQIVQNLIEQGLLFDKSGRWNDDLLTHLEKAFQKVEIPRSLDEKLELELRLLSESGKELIYWLAMAPHGLTVKMLSRLTGISSSSLAEILESMVNSKIIRLENNMLYSLYRSTFGLLIQKKLSLEEQQKYHDRLAQNDIGLNQLQVWYHLSYGSHQERRRYALEKMGESFEKEGKMVEALEYFQRLLGELKQEELSIKLEWTIKTSDILIWLDRFPEAETLLTGIEKLLTESKKDIPLKNRLLLWEKKGLALLTQQKVKEAGFYFSEGLELSSQNPETRVEEVRFLNDLAQIDMITGTPQNAIVRYKKSRELTEQLVKEEAKKITNNDLGQVYHLTKNYSAAISVLKEDIKIFSKLTNKQPLARALYTLAETFRLTQKFSKAVKVYEACIQIAKEENMLPILIRAYNGVGNVYLMNHKDQKALLSYQKAIEISVRLNDPRTKAALLFNQGLIYGKAKNLPQAARRFLLVKQILEQCDKKLAYEQQLLSKCYRELTAIAEEEKDPIKALTYHVERLDMIEKSETLKSEKFSAQLELAKLYLENRMEEQLKNHLTKMESHSLTEQERTQIKHLQERWNEINKVKHEVTMRVEL